MATRGLPLLNKLLYASGSLGGNVISRSRDLWLIYFYAPPKDADLPTLVPIGMIGVLLSMGKFIEALDDPLIGYWSDRTRSRWGRRIPFVLAATPFYALFFFLLWNPPVDHQHVMNAVYFFIILEAFHLFSTLSGGPFESLLPEIAENSQDRVSTVSWQVFFGVIGTAIAFIGSSLIVDILGFRAMALIMAAIGLLSRYVGLVGAWRRVKLEVEPVRLELRQAVLSTLANKQFLYFLPTYIFLNMALSLMTAILPYFVTGILGIEKEGRTVAVVTAVLLIVVIVTLPLVFRLTTWRGKAWTYSAAMLVAALYLPWLFFVGFLPGIPSLVQLIVFTAFIGVPAAAFYTFPNAIMADIIDYDALRTGMRREAIYYGTQALLEKFASALFPITLTVLLLLGGTAENPLGIRLVGVVAGVSAFVGYLAFRGYKLPDTVNAETAAQLR